MSTLQYRAVAGTPGAFWMWVNVSNPGPRDVENVTATITGADIVTPPPMEIDSNSSLGRGASHTDSFVAFLGASISVKATITSRSLLGTIQLTATGPDGTSFDGGTGASPSLDVVSADVQAAGAGTWTVQVTQASGLRPLAVREAISISYDAADKEQSVDNISASGEQIFGWMVTSSSPPNPPDKATITVEATITAADGSQEDRLYTAAFGKSVEATAAAASDEGAAAPLGSGAVVVVVAMWLLIPFVPRWRLRDLRRPREAELAAGDRLARSGESAGPPRTRSMGRRMLRKVPEITLYFWVIKVLCTTVGETAADQLNATSLAGTLAFGLSGTDFILAGLLAFALIFQFTFRKYIPTAYWVAVVLISVVGTLITDHLHDDLGVGLDTLTVLFAIALGVTFWVWFRSERTLSIHSIYTSRREGYYWAAILATFALGTAAGDFLLERLGAALGQVPSPDDPALMIPLHPQAALLISAAVFGGVIAFAFLGKRYFKLNEVLMFWLAYIFTRPLGANIGDVLTLSPSDGGLGLDKLAINLLFFAAIVGSVAYLTVTKKDVFSGEVQGPDASSGPPGAPRSPAGGVE